MKIPPLNSILLFTTCLLAAYQVVAGINGLENIPTIAYTISFGILLVAGLLIIILGYDVLNSPEVVIVSTIIPLSPSLGLIWEHSSSMCGSQPPPGSWWRRFSMWCRRQKFMGSWNTADSNP